MQTKNLNMNVYNAFDKKTLVAGVEFKYFRDRSPFYGSPSGKSTGIVIITFVFLPKGHVSTQW